MSERSETPQEEQSSFQGGWHAPRQASAWKAPSTAEKPQAAWRTVRALPEDLDEAPKTKGGWHTPDPQDTVFTADDVVEVSEKPTTTATRPEDILAKIVGKTTTRPEDAIPKASDSRSDDDTEAADDNLAGMAGLEALGALDDDEDEEGFSMSELMALASLEDDAQAGERINLDEYEPDDLSPAQRAVFNVASAVAEELPTETATPDSDAQAFADQQSAEESAADIAARMAQQYSAGSDTDQTRVFDDTSYPSDTQPYAAAAPDQDLAQRFTETRRQVEVLRQMYNQGQLDYQTLQTRLQEHTILDDAGVWWMIGYETNKWYRYNNASGQWEEAQPPIPLDSGAPRTATSELDPNDVIAGSLPYLPDNQQQEASNYDSQYTPQTDYSYSDTPLPRSGQPAVDPNRTVVGDAFDKDTLPYAAETLQGINYVETPQPEATIPSATYDDAAAYRPASVYDEAVDYPETAYPPSYDTDTRSETYDTYSGTSRTSLMRIAAFVVFALAACGILTAIGFVAYAGYEYNNRVEPYRAQITALAERQPDFQTAQILDANGGLIVELTSEEGARKVVRIEEGDVSPYFVHAVVSSEDPRFYENPGVDPVRIAGAYWQNLTAGEIQSGASTITQQIVRNLILQDTTVSTDRKLTEAFVAMEVASQYSKTEILNIYINEFFYGNQSYGVEAAAEFYFDKTAAELNIAESAMLVGLLPSPVATNPVRNREAAFEGMRVVLDRMIETGCLNFQHGNFGDNGFCIDTSTTVVTPEGGTTQLFYINDAGEPDGYIAILRSGVVSRPYTSREAEQEYPHFVNYVVEEIERVYGQGALTQRGFIVQTTLIPRIQDRAEEALAAQYANVATFGVQTGAVIAIDPTNGAIRALVGSPDFNNTEMRGQLDNTRTYQQPGSAIKPVLYTAALEADNGQYLTPVSILWDVRTEFAQEGQAPYVPLNYNPNELNGPVSLRSAVQRSLNIPAVRTLAQIGATDFIEMADALGMSFQDGSSFGYASALGTNETTLMGLTHAYATLANDGLRMPIFAIESITDADGNPVALPVREQPYQAVDTGIAYLMQNILSDHPARQGAFGSYGEALSGAQFGLPTTNAVAAKTGTSQDRRDLWTVGFTNNIAIGVWMGSLDNNSPAITGNLTGAIAAAPVWNAVMREALQYSSTGTFGNPPANVRTDVICVLTGTLSTDPNDCSGTRQNLPFLASQPPSTQSFVQTVEIDSWSGLRVSDYCREADSSNIVTRQFANGLDSYALNWLNNTSGGRTILSQFGVNPPLAAAPTEACQQGQAIPSIRFNYPNTDGTRIEGDVSITGIVNATNLASWQVLYSQAGSNNWQPLIVSRTDAIMSAGTTLAQWNTRNIPNGTYVLRLEAYSTGGGSLLDDVQVIVDNIQPTMTPSPTLLPTIEGFTPLPFGNSG